ncbi:MAG: hypothetical protein ACXWQO_10790 [Bdellovibrionota bacterium]
MLFRISLLLLSGIYSATALAASTLEELEQKVIAEKKAAEASGFTSTKILEKTEAGGNKAWLPDADAKLKGLQGSYDDLVKAELDTMLANAREVLIAVATDPAVSSKNRKKVVELLGMAEEFKERKGLYGTGPDVKRKTPYQNFFAGFKELHNNLNPLPLNQRLKEKFTNIVNLFRTFLALSGEIPDFLAKLYFPKKGEKPQMVGKLSDGFNAFADFAGYDVKVDGRELVPALPQGKKVLNIYAPTHRQGIHDGMLMAQVMPRDSLLFMAPKNFLGSALGSQFKGVRGFIAVEPSKPGQKKINPVDVLLKQLDQTGSQNVFIYGEGGLPTGILENMPIRENFGAHLIKGLREKGYEVNLIPVTYENSARFMNKRVTDVEGKNLRAVIHKAVPDQVLGEWEKYDPTFVNRYLRSVHMEGLETNDKQLMGILRPGQLGPELVRYLGACEGKFADLKN